MHSWEKYLVQIVDVSVSPSDVTVRRVVCVVDCGLVINPDTVIAQMQGGINFGLSAALVEKITAQNGRAIESNVHDFRTVRMNPPNTSSKLLTATSYLAVSVNREQQESVRH